MNRELQTAIKRLQALPGEAQAVIAPMLNDYLNRLDGLRADIDEGIAAAERGEVRDGEEAMAALRKRIPRTAPGPPSDE